jgi:C4-dicarboxylate transporter DctM subunit
VTIALVLVLLTGLIIGVPIVASLVLASAVGLLADGSLPITVLAQRIFVGLDSFPLLAAPLFILAGSIMEVGGISARITALAQALIGHIRGGLGMVVILATMIFSGVSGSSTADTAAIGSVMIPAMERRGYPKAFATAVVAAAGGMGILIPPSIIMIIYGLLTNTSIAALFVAGIVPGILTCVAGMAITYVIAKRENFPVEASFSLRELVVALGRSFWAIIMPVIILGGILLGIFTVTEAAVVAVVYGWIVAMFIYRELKWRDMPRILVESGVLTGIVMLVVGVAAVFGWLLTSHQVPLQVTKALSAISDNPMFFLFLINVSFLLIGCVFEVTAALIMTVPVLIPVALAYGIDPVHLGVVITANMGIGMVTPPVGICLYVACGISGVPMNSAIRDLTPFLAVMIATLLLITYVPAITLFLPQLLLGYGQ